MKKILVSSFLVVALLISPLFKVQYADATEYGLLNVLITKLISGLSTGSTSTLDMAKVQYCTSAANTCTISDATLTTLKLNLQTLQANAYKCILDQYIKLKRYPNSAEVNTLCGQEMSLLTKHQSLTVSAINTKDQSCQLKELACKDFPSVLNPIQQQFQNIAGQI